ncbi:hypothetical protein DMUE_3175 [Dictyocoela muelleri]|nr:hypothetical protein DMUE_3175 [Dictyocoela muelleri]
MSVQNNFYKRVILPIISGESKLVLAFLIDKKLFLCKQSCSEYLKDMKLSVQKNYIDCFVWRCNNHMCSKVRTMKNVRAGSVLQKTNIALSQILHLFYLWANDHQVKKNN